METSDENLVLLAQSGDGEAFSALVSRHYDLVYRLGFRMLGNRTEAQDLAQDVCAGLAAKLKGFRGEARFSTWLYRVSINAAKDRLRKRTTRQKAQEGWGEVESLNRQTSAEQKAELDWLKQAMGTLSPDLRETVALVLGEELTHAATAESLGISEGTVSWRMSEVKKQLRALAEQEERYP
ncbi:MAG: RNA polymerase sigma factor [Rhodobacteraceae bacterium]|nr:RNA polymerase sigma factor [Paracoccaceae bacterium]